MFEVILRDGNGVVSQVFDIEDPETALLAARTMFDDALDATPHQGYRRSLVTTFYGNGKLVRTFEGVRPSCS